MTGVNKVILVGNVGKLPDVVTFPSDGATPVKKASFPLATTEYRRNRENERVEITEWHNIVVYRKLAESCQQWLKKGSLVFLSGKISSRKYTGKDGVERIAYDIVCDDMKMLGGKNEGGAMSGYSSFPEESASKPVPAVPTGQAPANNNPPPVNDLGDDDIPF